MPASKDPSPQPSSGISPDTSADSSAGKDGRSAKPVDPDAGTKKRDMAGITRQFIDALPHAKAIGLDVRDVGAGRAEFILPYREDLIGDPETGVLHGGVVSTLLDTTCGAAVICHPESGGGTATLDLRIDYMRAATPGQVIVAKAECYHVTRSVAFVRAVALDDDTDRPVASATGAFTFKAKPRAGKQEGQA